MATQKKEIKQPKPLPAPNSDFYDFWSTFSAEEQGILKEVREFLNTKAAPIIGKYWMEDAFPFELLPALKELNIGGITVRFRSLLSLESEMSTYTTSACLYITS